LGKYLNVKLITHIIIPQDIASWRGGALRRNECDSRHMTNPCLLCVVPFMLISSVSPGQGIRPCGRRVVDDADDVRLRHRLASFFPAVFMTLLLLAGAWYTRNGRDRGKARQAGTGLTRHASPALRACRATLLFHDEASWTMRA